MNELEAKVGLFEAIASNSISFCDGNHYMNPYGVANYVNEVYEILTKKGNNNAPLFLYTSNLHGTPILLCTYLLQ